MRWSIAQGAGIDYVKNRFCVSPKLFPFKLRYEQKQIIKNIPHFLIVVIDDIKAVSRKCLYDADKRLLRPLKTSSSHFQEKNNHSRHTMNWNVHFPQCWQLSKDCNERKVVEVLLFSKVLTIICQCSEWQISPASRTLCEYHVIHYWSRQSFQDDLVACVSWGYKAGVPKAQSIKFPPHHTFLKLIV